MPATMPEPEVLSPEVPRRVDSLTGQLIDRDWLILGNLLPPSSPDELTAFVNPSQAILIFRA